MKKLLFQTKTLHITFTKRFFQLTPRIYNTKPTEFSIKDTHYETLNIEDVYSTKQVITAKFRKLAMKYHPDKNQGNEEGAAETFRKLEEAYKILSDTKERQMYDKKIGVPKIYKSSFLNMMQKNKKKK
eukprot:gene11758-5096_t